MLRSRALSVPLTFATLLFLPALLLAYPRDWDVTIADEARFEVEDTGTLTVDVPDADIVIRPGTSGEVLVEIEVASSNMDHAMDRYEDMDFRISGEGDGVEILADEPRGRWGWRGVPYVVTVTIELPESFNIEVETDDGDIQVRSVRGHVHLHTSDGDIRLGSVDSPHVLLDTSDGDIILGDIKAPDVQIETSDGSIEAEDIAGKDIDIRTSDGDIVIDALSGGLNAQTTDGDIRVHIDNLEPTTLRTGDGDITVITAATLNANVDLRAEDLYLRNLDLNFNGELSDHRARGKLNGGGPRLQASTRDGSITLSTRK